MAGEPRRCSRFALTGNIYVVRHGQRADHADDDWHATAERPHDPPLTPFGLEQAAATGLALCSESISAVYTSPFTRCMETASAIAAQHGLKLRVEPGLGEMLADCNEHGWGFDSDPYEDQAFSAARLAEAFDVDTTYFPTFDTAAGGLSRDGAPRLCFPESWDVAAARYQATLLAIQAQAEPFAVLVTHGAGVQSIAETVLAPDEVDDCSYCCITQIHQAGGGRWKCTQHGTAHHGIKVAAADKLVLRK